MTESKSHLLLQHYLKQLKSPTMLREYATVAASCTKDRCDYVSFLLRLVEREALDRDQRAAERRIKNARFPVVKTLDRAVAFVRGLRGGDLCPKDLFDDTTDRDHQPIGTVV
jgi:DNA replication protein DnaC